MATSRDTRRPATAPVTEASAFVVHVAWGEGGGSADCHGRVEHVSTGAALRFGSPAELIAFMQATLSRGPGRDDEFAAPAGSNTESTPPGETS